MKSLLKPASLAKLHPQTEPFFCSTSHCDVVYYSELNTFLIRYLKVPIFQKNNGLQK
ncbi:hypothetical protein ABHN11_21715 [Brevibacillus centrosporus]|uniref:hypothetical protein n=1 Tax=Brevibacillus centrosporus TaxID=54910 RepID=UPI0039871348